MQLQFHGAVRTVTGSQHLVRVNNHTILLDCGLHQGRRQTSYERNVQLPFAADAVDVMVLSHAHIDHSGNIPNLVKSGFRGDILCTYATRDLCAIMLQDSARIQLYDVEYLNKQARRSGEKPIGPIYTLEDALNSLKYFASVAYERQREIAPGVWLTLYDAGHMLGSAIVVLDIEDRSAGRERRLVFSGDLGRPDQPILHDPTPIEGGDILILESTYGDREHPDQLDQDTQLAEVINETARRRGKVIVPAFAVGRTQELVYRIHRLLHSGQIEVDLPIYVDSPLAIDATGVYRLHPEAYDEETSRFLLEEGGDPFGFKRMIYTRSVEQSKELNERPGPAVIISASGMAEAGRILHHLSHNIEDPRNTILIVGWQAPDTLGRRLVEKTPRVQILGNTYQVRANVLTITGLSAHADRSELLAWLNAFERRPEHIFLVHGDEEVSLAFADTLRRAAHPQVTVPHLGQSFSL